MSEERDLLQTLKLTPKQEKLLLAKRVKPRVSIVKVARQLGIPPRLASELAQQQTEVPVYRIGDGKAGGLLVDEDRLEDLINNVLLVRVNDPKEPKPAIDDAVIEGKINETGQQKRKSKDADLSSENEAERILGELNETSDKEDE